MIEKDINLSAYVFHIWTIRADSASPSPSRQRAGLWGYRLEVKAQSRRDALRPPASTTLTFNVDVSDVWGSHNTSKYNAATLLRHESGGFKKLSSFLKLPFGFNAPLYSTLQDGIFVLGQSFGIS